MNKQVSGIVKWFNDSKGYGFISAEGHGEVFVHYTHIYGDGFKTLAEEQAVTLDIIQGSHGPEARNVEKKPYYIA